MAKVALIILFLGCCICAVLSINDRLREVFSWPQVDFAFPDERTRQAAIKSREYVQANNAPHGVAVWRDKLFLTVPRLKIGVPSSLNYVKIGANSERNRSPLLIPYPNYEMNQIPSNKEDYSRIIHAVRMSVDECDRLWVIDMRKVNDTMWYGDPQILIIDLKTDRVVRKFTIGPKLRRVDGETWFINVVTDMDPKSCNQAFAYIPDVRWGLVVYSFENNTAWRLQHHFFYFDPVSTLIRSSGLRLGRTDGVFGVALSERRPDGYRTLFFHSLASTRIFSVDTNILKSNITVAETYDEYHGRGQRPHGMNAAAMTIDLESGVLLYSLVNQDGIGCWNPRRFEYLSNDTSAVLVTDPVTLQYPADLKVDANSNVWVVSNKMMKFRFRQKDLNLTEVNYRVFMAPVDELIKDTVCQLTRENYLTTMRPKTSDIKRLKTVVQAIQYK